MAREKAAAQWETEGEDEGEAVAEEDAGGVMDRPSPRRLLLYVVVAIIVTVLVYYLPEPFFLAIPTAWCSAALLNLVGVPAAFTVDWVSGAVYVGSYQIVRECTGIQVIAVFSGLILPLPRGTWNRKLLSLTVVSVMLFVANVLRVVFEIWLVYWGIMPWELAHYPMSFVLGVVGVFILCLVAIWLLPGFIETFEDILYYLFPPKEPAPQPQQNHQRESDPRLNLDPP